MKNITKNSMKKVTSVLFAAALSAVMITASSAGANAQKKLDKVGIALATLGNPFFIPLADGVVKTVKEYSPDVSVTTLGAEYEISKQASQIDSFIAAGAQIIFVNPADSVAVTPFLEKAKAAGIIVAAVDVGAQGAQVTVMTDNVQAGRIACEDLVRRLDGKGDVVIINGPPVSSIIDRVNGCREVFSQHPDIKILSDDQDGKASRDGGLQVMQGLLTRFEKIDAIFAINDPTAIGADLAARQFNRSEMIISTVDGSPDAVEAMKGGQSLIVSSASQDPFGMAALAAQQALDLFNGKELAQDVTLIDTVLVSKENVDSWTGWGSAPQ